MVAPPNLVQRALAFKAQPSALENTFNCLLIVFAKWNFTQHNGFSDFRHTSTHIWPNYISAFYDCSPLSGPSLYGSGRGCLRWARERTFCHLMDHWADDFIEPVTQFDSRAFLGAIVSVSVTS